MGNNLRITVISSHYPPAAGGVADYTQAWCLAMQELGHEVTLVTSTPDASEPGIEVRHFTGPWSLSGFAELRGIVEDSAPDAVVVQYVPHAYSPRGGGLPVAMLLSRLAKSVEAPVTINAHEICGAWSESVKRAPWHVSQRLAAAVLASSASAFVVTVKRRQEALQRLLRPWASKIHTIQIGPTVAAHKHDPQWRERHGVEDGAFVLTSLGLGHPTQEVGQLPNVLDALTAAGVDARLFVAGRLKVEHPHATHLGYVSAEEAFQMLAAGDLFVLPLTDGISGRRSAAISALAAGATVVTTAGRDTDRDLFQTLATTPAGDEAAFCQAVVHLATDTSARASLTESGQAVFAQHFSWPVVAEAWQAVLGLHSRADVLGACRD